MRVGMNVMNRYETTKIEIQSKLVTFNVNLNQITVAVTWQRKEPRV